MKHLKTYNESIRQFLKPKSEEEILDKLSKESDNEKIQKIIEFQLNYSLLPRNEEGVCIYEGILSVGNKNLTKLPDNLVVKGDLWCRNNQLTKLPDNLVVNGNLYCFYNKLTELPHNLIVKGYLYCSNNQITELPHNLIVEDYLNCNTLPKNIKKPEGVKNIIIS